MFEIKKGLILVESFNNIYAESLSSILSDPDLSHDLLAVED